MFHYKRLNQAFCYAIVFAGALFTTLPLPVHAQDPNPMICLVVNYLRLNAERVELEQKTYYLFPDPTKSLAAWNEFSTAAATALGSNPEAINAAVLGLWGEGKIEAANLYWAKEGKMGYIDDPDFCPPPPAVDVATSPQQNPSNGGSIGLIILLALLGIIGLGTFTANRLTKNRQPATQ